MQAVIPFSGFYDSIHSYLLDRECEFITQDSSGRERHTLAEHLHRYFGYTADMLDAYAKLYVEEWRDAAGIACEFHHVDSPRYYNFETDRIFATLADGEESRLAASVDRARLESIARARHTSRAGFISFYSPNVNTWGICTTWEPEQLHTLILASLPEDMPEEEDLMDSAVCNGCISDVVWTHMSEEARRVANIADYLRTRADRKYRIWS